ncbi:uncharacterized protein LOC128263557 [Drosophila gunungcola]|uniref:MADF domain-containing protein n=1 Tax=Drosophila gunungcola TaxID=103775 RepID=A0A9Q0BVK7_9MUSC|nr:uncharacterized protein LOC128263557 [Drosophila gunungcola]XP_052854656.1 uncharacterized protein LOC128263557 [Drosophila gunungcola]XP_052854663.1 uncharacterized protein LOC128263557 [Drosophila gunungcola]XP_052854667.1 uncharacterized protein LOC128263557 [Drosophila gunungcola]XP_052854668.1 uncharacterized protein LOC128263557 [Drosophila gunungcola]XP_052854669.1 uncharacterized protein LOC128263557 [Drosophila gunungcola]KAI8046337.1 hypothetical protein M5D96_002539 [Drosophila 
MEHLSHLYPPQLPKGRGRPRATYAQTGEFDLGLIREYRSHPVLYDRTNKRFKDKLYVAQIWDQLAHKLGYDATSLRERMTTLRNRYNIEKRRVENGLSTQASQWPLFESLQFLGDHIRPRRSFKNMSIKDEGDEQYEVDDYQSDSNGHMTSVKDELEEDCEIFDCEQALPVTTVLGIPLNTSDEANKSQRSMNGEMPNGKGYNHFAESYQRRHQNQPEYIISSPIINHANKSNKRGGAQQATEDHHAAKRRADDSLSISAFYPTPTPAPLPPAYAKFRGFGEFMCHSLCDMPAATALRLVQKFTRELVQTSIRSEGSGGKRKSDQNDQVDPVDQSSESQEEDE